MQKGRRRDDALLHGSVLRTGDRSRVTVVAVIVVVVVVVHGAFGLPSSACGRRQINCRRRARRDGALHTVRVGHDLVIGHAQAAVVLVLGHRSVAQGCGTGDVGENVVLGARGGDFDDGTGGGFRLSIEDGIVVGEEGGDDGEWDVEGGREDNNDVADTHLVDVAVAHDFDQEGAYCPNECPVRKR